MNKLHKCTAGAVGVVTALVLPILLGFGSLGVEVGHWYLVERQMQGAADAAAISAAAQYIADQVAGNTSSTMYQTVGQRYAGLNGFTIPVANTCLITASGDNCGPVRNLDARPIKCGAPPCIVAEITQDTFQWLSTNVSMEPNGSGSVQPIPTPTLLARAVVSMVLTQTANTPQGDSCILTLANAQNAIQVRGNGDIHANCGLLIDGGIDQNANQPLCTNAQNGAPCGGLTLEGANAMVHISNLTVAGNDVGPTGSTCPDPTRCFLYNPLTTVLPASKIFTKVASPDPFVARIFTKPTGQVVTGIALVAGKGGTGYTKGTRTFTVVGGSGPAAKFTATVSGGTVTGGIVLVDPGQYATLPANPVSVVADDGKGSGAQFTLAFGTCLPSASFPAVPVPGRAYCSINLAVGAKKTVTFPTGIYYIEGGELSVNQCAGFCLGAGNYTTDSAGVTFVLTNTANGTTYAQMAISGNASINFTAPPNNINADGSPCAANCTNTTWGLIIFQDRNAPETTSMDGGGVVTSSNLAAGTTLNRMDGCGNQTICRTLSGTLYLPRQTMAFQGDGQVSGLCFGLVSKYLDDAGVPIFQNGCLPGTTGGSGGSGTTTGGSLRLAQ